MHNPKYADLFFILAFSWLYPGSTLIPSLSGHTRPGGDGGEVNRCALLDPHCQRRQLLKPAVAVAGEWWRAGLRLQFSSLKAPRGLLWLFAPCSAGIFKARSELIAPGSVLSPGSLHPLSKGTYLACPSFLSTTVRAGPCVWADSHPSAPLPWTNVVSVKRSPEQQHVPLWADGKFQRHKGYLGTDFKVNKLDAEKKSPP